MVSLLRASGAEQAHNGSKRAYGVHVRADGCGRRVALPALSRWRGACAASTDIPSVSGAYVQLQVRRAGVCMCVVADAPSKRSVSAAGVACGGGRMHATEA